MGDTEPTVALEALLAHSGWVHGLAHTLVHDASQVDDVVQETWMAAIERPPATAGSPRSWLAGVARNVVRGALRTDRRRERREREHAQQERLPSAEELVHKAEMQRLLVESVLDLEEPYRQTVMLRYYEGLSAEEIAHRLAIPASTVRNRQRRALALLRQKLDHTTGNDRRTWCLQLIPLAKATTTLTTTITTTTGGFAMSATGLTVATALVGAGLFGWNVFGGESTPAQGQAAPPNQEGATQEKAAAQDPAQAGTQDPRTEAPTQRLQGIVKDAAGRPVAGAQIFVGAWDNPFLGNATDVSHVERGPHVEGRIAYWGKQPLEKRKKYGILVGRVYGTGADGRYSIDVPEKRRVHVRLFPSTGLRPNTNEGATNEGATHEGRWVEKSAVIDFQAKRVPTATLNISLTDQTTGKRIQGFKASIRHKEARRGRTWASNAALVKQTLELADNQPGTFTITIVEPAWAKSTQQVTLTANARRDVRFLVQSGMTFTGQVVSATTRTPLAGALVYWGNLERMRHRWSNHFDVTRVTDGVRTNAEGRFELNGSADQITIWHEDRSPMTIAPTAAMTIALPSRGTVKGRIATTGIDTRGAIEIVLDKHHKTNADATGRYVFENVAAGMHHLQVSGERWVGVLVSPGDSIEIDHSKIIDEAEVKVLAGGKPVSGRFGAGLRGIGKVFTWHEFGAKDGNGKVRGIYEGRYLLQSRGRFALVDFERGKVATADLGAASLTIQALPGGKVQVKPLGLDAKVTELVAGGLRRDVPPGGEVRFDTLPAGSYEVGLVGGRSIKVELKDGGDTRASLLR